MATRDLQFSVQSERAHDPLRQESGGRCRAWVRGLCLCRSCRGSRGPPRPPGPTGRGGSPLGAAISHTRLRPLGRPGRQATEGADRAAHRPQPRAGGRAGVSVHRTPAGRGPRERQPPSLWPLWLLPRRAPSRSGLLRETAEEIRGLTASCCHSRWPVLSCPDREVCQEWNQGSPWLCLPVVARSRCGSIQRHVPVDVRKWLQGQPCPQSRHTACSSLPPSCVCSLCP